MYPTIFGIIPARAGSKGIVSKNIRLVDGKPLIQYTIKAARDSEKLESFIVSTDSEEIGRIAASGGADVPFLRPKEYATDRATTVGVVDHALKWFESAGGKKADYLLLLQPTTPLRTGRDIDRAIAIMLENPDAECLISCYDAGHAHPSIAYVPDGSYLRSFIEHAQMSRRQEFSSVYIRNGCIYLIKRDYFLREKRLVSDHPLSYIMPRWRSINIDEELDLFFAEAIIRGWNKTEDA